MSVLSYIPFTNKAENTALPSVICLGNFDGVHIGHARLLEETVKICRSSDDNIRACALCFVPFPSDFFSKTHVRHIMSTKEKLDTFKKMGLDGAYICNFEEIHDYSPSRFIKDILINSCACKGVVCGFNYRFGHRAAGTPKDLEAVFDTFKMIDPVMMNWQTVSSSLIKENIEKGNISSANEMLGRPFSITHTVVHGKNLGIKLGFPTLNHIFKTNELIPAFGIYATTTTVDNDHYVSVTNIGTRPTVSDSDIVTCETHIIACDNGIDLYGREIKVSFFKKIRDEKRFSSLDELSAAIALDVETAKNYFSSQK